MPTNLPPHYYDVEEQFRKAQATDEKIALLEEMMRIVPKHKGTDHLRADLKRKMAQLKGEGQAQKAAATHQVSPYHIDREGAGQLVLVGPTNVGKSAIVRAFTRAEPEVSPAPFTTWGPTPGMMPIDNIQVQLIDIPPINPDFVKPDMIDLVRRTDLMLLVVDLQGFPIEQYETALAFLETHRIAPAHLRAVHEDRFDLIYVPALVVANKADSPAFDDDFAVLAELLGDGVPLAPLSAETGYCVDAFKQEIFDRLNIVRVYARPPGREPDMSAPFVMQEGGTIENFAAQVHRDFVKRLKSARVWGKGVFDGQVVSRDHILHDGDIVELRI